VDGRDVRRVVDYVLERLGLPARASAPRRAVLFRRSLNRRILNEDALVAGLERALGWPVQVRAG
jgi:hypothetical protein